MSWVYWGIVIGVGLMVGDLLFCLSLLSSGGEKPGATSGLRADRLGDSKTRESTIRRKAA